MEPTGGSEGGLWSGAEGKAALAHEAVTAAGVTPPRVVTARGRRDNLALLSQVSELFPPKQDAGDGRAADTAVFHNCKWLAFPPTATHSWGVLEISRCRLCISCSSPVGAFLLVYWSSPSHRIPVRRRSLHFLGTSCIH